MSWSTLFSKEKPVYLCDNCRHSFSFITGEVCQSCHRPLQQLNPAFQSEGICHDCIRWEEHPVWKGVLDQNISIFEYNDFLKEVFARYKFRGDYVLAYVFAEFIQTKLQKYHYLVPIPLSEERLQERGFNQAEALIRAAGFKPTMLLSRLHTEKQSKKSRHERIHLSAVFSFAGEHRLQDKDVLLIDDIYTTGSTVRHAAKVLKNAGAQHVFSLTIGRG
ncbi:ComF family protein [Bacillus sp. 03113]|uniref:ComF family protein n=1 Tax=Bacillus sp. 03113 TaxID=2578211 RepID=UPI0037C17781